MKQLLPTPAEERWIAMMQRHDIAIEGASGGWKQAGFFPRIAFFLLGALTTCGLLGFLMITTRAATAASILTAAASVAFAEFLILERRLFGFGFEEAVYLLGLASLALVDVNHFREVTTAATLTIACAAVGVRLRNPLAFTCALAAACWWAEAQHVPQTATASASVLAALVVWGALCLRFDRPSTQRILEWLAVAFPITAYGWAKAIDVAAAGDGVSIGSDGAGDHGLAFAMLGAAVVAAIIGIRKRQHALLIATGVCVAAAAYELRDLTPLPWEQKLIIYGAAILAAALVAERLLRRERGVTSFTSTNDDAWRVVEMLGAAAVSAAAQPDATPAATQPAGPTGGGGQFGGAGASGDF